MRLFNNGYRISGTICIKKAEKCVICGQTAPCLAIDPSVGEYDTGFLCQLCISGLFRETGSWWMPDAEEETINDTPSPKPVAPKSRVLKESQQPERTPPPSQIEEEAKTLPESPKGPSMSMLCVQCGAALWADNRPGIKAHDVSGEWVCPKCFASMDKDANPDDGVILCRAGERTRNGNIYPEKVLQSCVGGHTGPQNPKPPISNQIPDMSAKTPGLPAVPTSGQGAGIPSPKICNGCFKRISRRMGVQTPHWTGKSWLCRECWNEQSGHPQGE